MTGRSTARRQKRSPTSPRPLKGADKLILATDPDREGEAISWHVLDILKAKKALKDVPRRARHLQRHHQAGGARGDRHPREIDQPLVDAYLARRALDYLVGFTLSPVLWRKLPGSRSAGRVQSVALRLICDREAEIEASARNTGPSARSHRQAPAASGPPDPSRRQEARQARHRHKDEASAPRHQGASRAPALQGRAVERSPPSATRIRPSPPRPCSRKPRASSASAPRDHADRPAPL
jgi:DNA topoisomerase-1